MKHLILAAAMTALSAPALASPISFKGAELVSLPNIVFPTGNQTIVGDSLLLNVVGEFSALASLSLDSFNVDVRDFEVQIDVTKLRRDDNVLDQDLRIYLSDGVNVFGGVFVDGSPDNAGTTRVDARRDELLGDGQSFRFIESVGFSTLAPAAFDNNYLATVRIQAAATQTSITGDINNGAVRITGSTTTLFDPNNGGLSLVIGGSEFGENYLINSVTFTRGVSAPTAVSEPGTLGGLALGLATLGLGLYRRRFA